MVVHGLVVGGQQLGRGDDRRDLVGAHAVADLTVTDGEMEPAGKALGRPDLLRVIAPEGPLRAGDLPVLHPGGVPDEPGDGVGVRIDAPGQVLLGQAVEGPLDEVRRAAERFEEHGGGGGGR